MSELRVRDLGVADLGWAGELLQARWGGEYVITRGRRVSPLALPGLCAERAGRRVGLLTYEVVGEACEIVTLDALEQRAGAGTRLVEEAAKLAFAASCRRLWLVTTNDNLDALRFLQRRGFTLAALHRGAAAAARKLKPSTPLAGEYGIPVRDELELELRL